MQKKQLRNLRRNTSKIQKMSGDKKEKKEPSGGENYQEGLQQENYSDGQIRSMTKNTEQDQKEIEKDRKKKEQGSEEQQK